MQFSLKALFFVVSLSCVAAAFPGAVALWAVVAVIAGMSVSLLMPIELHETPAKSQLP